MISKQRILDIYGNLDIPYWTGGKNVSVGWVNVQCPFCADSSNHCGVNPETELFNCWKCPAKGHFVDLLIELTGLSFGVCKDMVSDSATTFKERPIETIRSTLEGEATEFKSIVNVEVRLPKTFEFVTTDINFSLLDDYLKRRNISRATLMKYSCGVCRAGKYMNRMIIPVYYQEKLVSFQAADLTGFADLKYKSAPLSMGRINDFLYNYDKIEVGGRMIVEEGVLDAWRTGDEAVAAFTSNLTEAQKKLIIAKNLEELYFCFDCELIAYYKSLELAKEFEAYISKVEVLRLPYGQDPNLVGSEKIYQLISETLV